MPATIAFFPWLESREPVRVGSVRLTPYRHRQAPGDQPSMKQADIDGVLRAYSRKPTSRDRHATILEVGRWRMGMPASPRTIKRLFAVRDLITFSALSRRRLFTHLEYTNSHAYSLVVQRFEPGYAGTFAFITRRRDGGTNQLWGSDEFAFHIPHHVRADSRMALERDLLSALLKLPRSLSHINEAIREYNAANTDSLDVPEHVEMVMMKSAFEWLLSINENAKEFQRALADSLNDLHPKQKPTGPLARKWRERVPNVRAIEAWARDFCAVRGMAAHGRQRIGKGRSVLSATSHLAFASMLFPLLVKKTLRDAGLFKMDEFDAERLRAIDSYLMHDPFARRDRRSKHPWAETETKALTDARAALFYPTMMKALAKAGVGRGTGGKADPA